jgi:hypothetical protein
MHPAKTELARIALAARGPTLNTAERRVLILCDGKRPPDELTTLLGADTPAILERLRAQGFITGQPTAEPRRTTDRATTARNRRSAAIVKIYMVDMLGVMRRGDADAMSAHLHAARSDPEVMATIDAALRFIAEVSGPRYARKVATRVAKVAPEVWLSRPDSVSADLSSETPNKCECPAPARGMPTSPAPP